MPIAGVPQYLGSDFRSAPPALRFGMYLPIWTERADQEREVKERAKQRSHEGRELSHLLQRKGMDAAIERLVLRHVLPNLWNKNDSGGRDSWKKVIELTNDDSARMKALVDRQAALFQAVAGLDGLEQNARSVAPFMTGLGNEHPLENGFAFLNPYGLPYLPGSGVKGVVRRAAEELAHPDFFQDGNGWTLPAIWHLFGFEPGPAARPSNTEWEPWIDGFSVSNKEVGSYLDAVLDGAPGTLKLKDRVLQADNRKCKLLQERHLHVRGALEFWDVVPQIKGKKLAVEIMTPHHSHYYQDKAHAGSASPHDSGKPNPISFLTVPPGSSFAFHVRCDHPRLSRFAPELAKDGQWRTLLEAAFKHAFEWLGFGAKTAVGYGAMQPMPRVNVAATAATGSERRPTRVEQEQERRQVEAERVAADQRRKEQEAFDALPSSARLLIEAERALKAFQGRSTRLDHAPLNEAKSQGNRLAAEAAVWPDATEREKAASFLEHLYEVIGWHEAGVKASKRTKQIDKKQEAIARVRRGP